jgi:hypothetical protein
MVHLVTHFLTLSIITPFHFDNQSIGFFLYHLLPAVFMNIAEILLT